jgi:6-phosphogluconolactonase
MRTPGHLRSLMRLSALLVLAAALVAALPATALAKPGKKHGTTRNAAGAFYTQTNDPNGNAVLVYARKADGKLTLTQTVNTRGRGAAATPPFGFPIADGAGSVNLTPDGRLLFVVNAGDNTVSSFRVTHGHLKLVDRQTSGGILPISVTSSGHLLYVLNELSGSIFGLRFSNNGRLTPIANSEQALSTVGPNGVSAQIVFAPGGKVLVATLRGLPAPQGDIDTFVVKRDGSTGPAQPHTANAPNPFGFAFAGPNHVEVSNAGLIKTASGQPPNPLDPTQFDGSASSYNLTGGGGLSATSNVPSGGRAACWLVVTKDNKYAFVTNTLSTTPTLGPPAGIGSGGGALSRYLIAPNGTLTLLGQTNTGPGTPTDMALSSDSRYLYVTNPTGPAGPDTSHIDVYTVGSGGTLTQIQAIAGPGGKALAIGVSGAAAH